MIPTGFDSPRVRGEVVQDAFIYALLCSQVYPLEAVALMRRIVEHPWRPIMRHAIERRERNKRDAENRRPAG